MVNIPVPTTNLTADVESTRDAGLVWLLMMKRLISIYSSLFLTVGISNAEFRVGAAAVDATPAHMPVIQNGGFLEQEVRLISDPLFARALVLEQSDGGDKIAIVVVDSCMMDREFCDGVKRMASEKTGIAHDKILISATHTHSAPSVMDYCLGSRKDPRYAEYLPGRVVESIVQANAALQPAKAAWTRFDAGDFTKSRRWSFRSGTERTDPFGNKTVRANMHPGHLNPDAIGETGPVDPWFTLLSVRDLNDKPLAVLGNFSMHYFGGHAGLSADYFGYYVRALKEKLADGNVGFVGILSQGTSGDIYRKDYAKPEAREPTIQEYSGMLADMSAAALENAEYRTDIPVTIAESRMTIGRRVPDSERLEWARGIVESMGARQPKNQQEVYAQQAIYLHENPATEVVLQAARVGELGITGMPNEVYALTGLKLKYRSPFELTMNISLANGASGYIPPPEQFPLGGYNTWPARTAGLVPEAETRIVEANLTLLEKIAGRGRRTFSEPLTGYAKAVLVSKPRAYWRLGDMDGTRPLNEIKDGGVEAAYEPGVVFHLPGIADSHCAHFAGGRVAAVLPKDTGDYSVAFWFWNGVQHDVRPVCGYLFSRGKDGDESASGDHLGIGGTHSDMGKLIAYNGNESEGLLAGKTELGIKKWHHVAMVRSGDEIVVHLDGREEIRGKLELTHGGARDVFYGGRSDNFSNLEGRLDEAAFYDRALSGAEVRSLYAASAPMESPPSSPEESLKQCHVRDGYTLELVAAEPLVRDPVAVDWGADSSVWVAEMADYPYGVEGGGRVARLLDTDGDGKLDQRQDFLNELSFPAGVMSWGKGVIIAAAPDILYAEDRDGDGVAEHRELWFSGFIEGNQQLRVNGLRLGLDGWIYCANGGHHAGFGSATVITAHKTGEKIELGSRDFRFKPDGSFEPESGPSQFGRVRDDYDNWFGVQNALPLWHYVLPDRYLRRNPAVAAPDPRQQLRGHMASLFPAKATQKRFHGFDHVGRYTSACGISIYRDDILFPRVDGEMIAFTCAPFHNLVQRHILKPDGFTFSAERADDGEIDFFASRDRWCRPVMSRTAPDGSLWIVDMYRYMIEHPDWLPPEGKDELRPHYRMGDDRGRIYRIFPTGKKPAPFKGITDQTPSDSNGIVRDLLLRDGKKKECSLQSSIPGERALVLREMEVEPSQLNELADDPSGHVLIQLAFSLGDWKSEKAGQCLAKVALRHGDDVFFRAAVLSSAPNHLDTLLRVVVPDAKADRELVRSLLTMAPDDVAIRYLSESGNFVAVADWLSRRKTVDERFHPVLERARSVAHDETQPVELRAAAIRLVDDCVDFLSAAAHPELKTAAVVTLCEKGKAETVFANWRTLSPELRALAIEQSLGNKVNAMALLNAIQNGISAREISAAQRQRLTDSKDQTIRETAGKLFAVDTGSRGQLVESYQPVLAMKGDVNNGRQLFGKVCASCHQLDAVGKAIGPDLRTITNRGKADLLVAILDPSRSVEPRYLGYYAAQKDETAYGMIAAETATSVIFKLPDGNESVIARKDILSIDSSGRSFMPEGLEASLDPQAMADLLGFLDVALGGGLGN
jgi:putative membrane-bound dehydrogenase-like protein